ncbi:MAG: hypothetical protein CMP59_02875 [Flavobacteriales bacterium]|nr:hypothetical protein [Flavobacteriales bacterium]|tara:strand:+ start:537 stop:932 length:396 start_codon:yes stop_codon:yes gene_type:complete
MIFKPTIKFYHYENEEESLGRYRALIEANRMRFLPINIEKEGLSNTKLMKISRKVDGGLRSLINHNSHIFKAKLAGKRYDQEDLLSVLYAYPRILHLPIAESRKMAMSIANPRDLLKFNRIKETQETLHIE